MTGATRIPRRREGFRVDRDGGETWLFNEVSGHSLQLNTFALTVWQLCDGVRPVADIISLLEDAYPEASDAIPGDVEDAIEALRSAGALTVEAAERSGKR